MTPESMQAIIDEFRRELPAIVAGNDKTLEHWASRVKRRTAWLVADVIYATSVETGVPVEVIMGDQRAAPIVRVRHIAINAAHKRFPAKSAPELGRAFRLDHTTILHAIKTWPKRASDPLVKRCFERVLASVT